MRDTTMTQRTDTAELVRPFCGFSRRVSITSRVNFASSALDAAHNEVQPSVSMVAVAVPFARGLDARLAIPVLVGLGLIEPGCGPPI
jgi:hypothetical protein